MNGLRAAYARDASRAPKIALMTAMATTGSPEDVAFLSTQFQGQFIGSPNVWPTIQLAATTLGLLRATPARDSLRAALARNGGTGTGFAGRAVTTALATLDRPPCVRPIAGELSSGLVAIVMRCGPQAMGISTRYGDTKASGVWAFSDGGWQFGPRTPADTGITATVKTSVAVAPDGKHAEVMVSTRCGMLCGEGWTFRLFLSGTTWKVVGAVMNWVS